MSYRIDYAPRREPGQRQPENGAFVPVLTICFFALFALLLQAFWPEGRQVLVRLLLGSGGRSLVRCIQTVADSLESGQPLYDAAVTAFRDVIHGY